MNSNFRDQEQVMKNRTIPKGAIQGVPHTHAQDSLPQGYHSYQTLGMEARTPSHIKGDVDTNVAGP